MPTALPRHRRPPRHAAAFGRAWRQLALHLVLPLLLLVSQQGAWRHELGHLRASAAQTESERQQPTGKLCESCLAYAQVADLVQPGVPTLAAPSVDHAAPVSLTVAFTPAAAPAARSRGPPTVL